MAAGKYWSLKDIISASTIVALIKKVGYFDRESTLTLNFLIRYTQSAISALRTLKRHFGSVYVV